MEKLLDNEAWTKSLEKCSKTCFPSRPLVLTSKSRSWRAAAFLSHSNANSHSPLWIPTHTMNLCCPAINTDRQQKLHRHRRCSTAHDGKQWLLSHFSSHRPSSPVRKIIGFQVSAKIYEEEYVLDLLTMIHSFASLCDIQTTPLFWLNSTLPVARFECCQWFYFPQNIRKSCFPDSAPLDPASGQIWVAVSAAGAGGFSCNASSAP